MNLKKIGKLFTSKFVGTGPSPYKKGIYRAAVSQRLRNTALYQLRCPGSSLKNNYGKPLISLFQTKIINKFMEVE